MEGLNRVGEGLGNEAEDDEQYDVDDQYPVVMRDTECPPRRALHRLMRLTVVEENVPSEVPLAVHHTLTSSRRSQRVRIHRRILRGCIHMGRVLRALECS